MTLVRSEGRVWLSFDSYMKFTPNPITHRRPQGEAQGGLAPSLPELWHPSAPLHPLKLCSNHNNAKRLQHVAAIVSVIELITLACMYN